MFHRILWHLCWVATFLGSDKLHHPAKTCWNNTQQQHRNNILFGPRQKDFNMIKPFYFHGSNHLIEENIVWMCKSKPMHQWYSLNKKTYVSVSLPCLGPKNQAVSHYVYIYIPVTFIITMVPCWSTILRHPLKKAMVQYTVDMCWLLEVSKSW